MTRTLPLLLTLAFLATFIAGLTPIAPVRAFEAGQRWSCVTDQGADAFLDVRAVEGEAVSFDWGVLDPETHKLDSLCRKRAALSLKEMSEFCKLLGDEFSDGHVLLSKACAAEASQ